MTMTQTSQLLGSFASLALLVGAAGCATTSHDTKPAESTASTESAAANPAGPNDAQIAAIVVTANQIDIDNGELAQEVSTNEEVKTFAQRMIEDHAGVNKAAVELVTRLGVTPEESDTSRGLAASAEETRESMRALTGDAFDKAYVDNEVAYHEAVIGMLDETLIPSAQNAELKEMLVNVRPAFVAHLEHARTVQASLNGAAASAHRHHH